MMDYFGDMSEEANVQATGGQLPYNNTGFEFTDLSSPAIISPSTIYQPPMTYDEAEDDTARRIREEEQQLQDRLRRKADEEHTLKEQRKQKGTIWLKEFVEGKAKQTAKRGEDNLENERRGLEEKKKADISEGWMKVVASIRTKQGEQQGKKSVARMREAILHKRDDKPI